MDPTNTLTSYIQDISVYPLLTKEEEIELAYKIRAGDNEAREKFICSNLRLVISIAKKMIPANKFHAIIMDAIQEGNLGLMKAVERFDPAFKARFSTYGTWWIRQSLVKYLHNNRLIYLPENVSVLIFKVHRMNMTLMTALGRPPLPVEIAIEMGLDYEKVLEALVLIEEPTSLNISVGRENEELELGDLLEDFDSPSPEELTDKTITEETLHQVVSELPYREKQIVEMRFGLIDGQPYTLDALGELFEISRERVRQLQNIAFDRLREKSKLASLNVQ